MTRPGWLVVALLAGGCKDDATPARPTTEAVGSAPRVAAGAPPALGCFAWSATPPSVACVTGDDSSRRLQFMNVLDIKSIELGTTIDAATAANVNELLAKDGYRPLHDESRKHVTPNAPLSIGFPPIMLRLSGDTVVAKCRDGEATISLPRGPHAVTARALGEIELVETTSGRVRAAWVIENKSCFLSPKG